MLPFTALLCPLQLCSELNQKLLKAAWSILSLNKSWCTSSLLFSCFPYLPFQQKRKQAIEWVFFPAWCPAPFLGSCCLAHSHQYCSLDAGAILWCDMSQGQELQMGRLCSSLWSCCPLLWGWHCHCHGQGWLTADGSWHGAAQSFEGRGWERGLLREGHHCWAQKMSVGEVAKTCGEKRIFLQLFAKKWCDSSSVGCPLR